MIHFQRRAWPLVYGALLLLQHGCSYAPVRFASSCVVCVDGGGALVEARCYGTVSQDESGRWYCEHRGHVEWCPARSCAAADPSPIPTPAEVECRATPVERPPGQGGLQAPVRQPAP